MSNLKPGAIVPDYHLELSDGSETYGLRFRDFEISNLSEDRFGVFVRNVGKQIGDFDEQRDWTGGMGSEYFNDDRTGYFESEGAWTLSKGHVLNGLQWKFAKGLRNADFRMPGSVQWRPLISSDRYLADNFNASASYTATHLMFWIRKRGNPGTLTVAILADDGDTPGTAAVTATITAADVTDTVSVLYDFDISTSLTGSTKYYVAIYGASTDTKSSHWEVACDAASGGWNSAAGSSWDNTSYSPYYRVTGADTARRFYPFIFDSALYVVDSKDDLTTASQLYINGLRGKATSATSTTLVDSGQSLTADRYIGAYIKIIRGTGAGQVRQITDNDTTSFTVATWDKTPSTDSEYVVYSTDWWTEIATSTGLGVVTGYPAIANGVVYFPQGESDAIRAMHLDYTDADDHAWADDGSNYATLLHSFSDPTAGVQIWRANISSTATTVSRATAVAWGSNMTFGTAISLGSSNFIINGLTDFNNMLYAFKEDSVWSVSNDRATKYNYGIESVPSIYNGKSAQAHNNFLYFSWLFSDNQLYGGTVSDIGLGWKGAALANGREGFTSCYESAGVWLFRAINAGTGASSVAIYDGINWHEILRGFEAGREINSIKWQPCQGTRNRLWTDIGGELIYQEFPLNKANPLYDTSVDYQHEGIFVSSTIDMGTGARLPKFIKGLTAVIKNLNNNDNEVFLDYQFDDDINTSTWYEAGSYVLSPEQELPLNLGNVRQFRYRLRMNTVSKNTPADVQGVVPNGFGRIPYRKIYNLRCSAGFEYTPNGNIAVSPDKLLDWLYRASEFPGRISTKSVYNLLHNKTVIVSPPQVFVTSPEFLDQNWKGTITISIMEL